MRRITLKIPESLHLNEKEIVVFLASQLYNHGKLSLGQAADLAGLSKRAFAEILGTYNVSIFNFPASDLSNDIVNV